jgi:hypothetical protein
MSCYFAVVACYRAEVRKRGGGWSTRARGGSWNGCLLRGEVAGEKQGGDSGAGGRAGCSGAGTTDGVSAGAERRDAGVATSGAEPAEGFEGVHVRPRDRSAGGRVAIVAFAESSVQTCAAGVRATHPQGGQNAAVEC